jgi:hypothetical protein
MALLPYQVGPCELLTKVLAEKGSALDASDTGTGKTFVAVNAAKRLGIPVGIVCPKAVIPSWERVCKLEGLKPAFILNYEKIVRGNTGFVFREGKKFTWNFAGIVIWDEVQRCKAHSSLNSRLLISAWETKLIRCLCLSATAFQNPLDMRALGFALGIHNNFNFWKFAFENGARRDRWGGFAWKGSTGQLEAIHKKIFPDRGVRVRIKELGKAFPENKIIAEALEVGDPDKLNKIYEDAQKELDDLKEKKKNDYPSAMVIMLRARQQAEILKVPVLVEQAKDLLEEGKSCIIFTNFNATLDLLSKYLETDCVIKEQDAVERQKNIDDFQSNKSRIIICNIQAGGVGLSLHDLSGDAPRVVLLCPTWNAVDLRQALGRAHRGGRQESGDSETDLCERNN